MRRPINDSGSHRLARLRSAGPDNRRTGGDPRSTDFSGDRFGQRQVAFRVNLGHIGPSMIEIDLGGLQPIPPADGRARCVPQLIRMPRSDPSHSTAAPCLRVVVRHRIKPGDRSRDRSAIRCRSVVRARRPRAPRVPIGPRLRAGMVGSPPGFGFAGREAVLIRGTRQKRRQDFLGERAENDAADLPPPCAFVLRRAIDPDIITAVDVDRAHRTHVLRPHSGQPLQANHRPDNRADDPQHSGHVAQGNRTDYSALPGGGAARLQRRNSIERLQHARLQERVFDAPPKDAADAKDMIVDRSFSSSRRRSSRDGRPLSRPG